MTMKKIAARACLACVTWLFGLQNAWALLPIEHWQQDSGAQVWLVHSPGIPMVDVQIAFDAGSRRDLPAQAGLAQAVALMSSKGVAEQGAAPALDENQLGAAWADLGASFGASAGRDSFGYALRTLTEPDLLARATQLAARQIAAPSFPAAVWENERQRWGAAIKESYTRPGPVAARAFAQAVYASHPYGARPSPESLAQIAVADMQGFHTRFVRPCRARISLVGALDKAQAQALVQQLLAGLPAGGDCPALPAVADAPDLAQASVHHIPFAAAQAQVLIGQVGIARNDPDFLALLLGNHILGGSGLVSRLTEEVREKRGLSYSVYSDFSTGLNRGAFVIGLQTRPDQAQEALAVARRTLARYVAEGPTEEELRAAKANLIGGFALRIDSNQKLLANVANIAWNGLPLDYLEHWTQRLQALTREQVRAALQRHLQPERMATVVVGGQP
ncbi:M16 family metallopeptidase [Acidovorax sp. HDW3]|uniref:M16 family metallopeptidase n=1 Tax=Acidovorax sp. HDW3 TaxID=2714923 RepID=UPI00351BB393